MSHDQQYLRVLRLDDVIYKTGLAKNTIYHRMRRGEFPKNFPIGGCARTVGWLEGEIDEFITKNVPWFEIRDHIVQESATEERQS